MFNPIPMKCCEVFNLEDDTEWSPEIAKAYEDLGLAQQGYDLGDFFYRRIGTNDISFVHCFKVEELEQLCEEAGLRIVKVWFVGYSNHYGKVLKDKTKGAILIKAQKR